MAVLLSLPNEARARAAALLAAPRSDRTQASRVWSMWSVLCALRPRTRFCAYSCSRSATCQCSYTLDRCLLITVGCAKSSCQPQVQTTDGWNVAQPLVISRH